MDQPEIDKICEEIENRKDLICAICGNSMVKSVLRQANMCKGCWGREMEGFDFDTLPDHLKDFKDQG